MTKCSIFLKKVLKGRSFPDVLQLGGQPTPPTVGPFSARSSASRPPSAVSPLSLVAADQQRVRRREGDLERRVERLRQQVGGVAMPARPVPAHRGHEAGRQVDLYVF